MKREKCKRKSVFDTLSKFSPMYKEEDYIEVTEWSNQEGWDITIGDNTQFKLSMDELEAINYLTKVILYDSDEQEE